MSRTAVTLDNCTIKKSKFSDEMEVVLNHSTNICKSPQKITPVKQEPTRQISLDTLDHNEDYVQVNVVAKVMRVDESVEVKPNLKKQDC